MKPEDRGTEKSRGARESRMDAAIAAKNSRPSELCPDRDMAVGTRDSFRGRRFDLDAGFSLARRACLRAGRWHDGSMPTRDGNSANAARKDQGSLRGKNPSRG